MTESTVGVKRKRPPSFPHVHPSRAKKFKKAWVDKAKIRSQWKAEKRKEGLTEKAKLDLPAYRLEEEDGDHEDDSASASNDEAGRQENRDRSHDEHFATRVHPSRSKLKSKEEEVSPESRTMKEPGDNVKSEEDNVRELMRKAYSQSSLHTFKSNPLKKRAASGRSRGEKGKGQPDMRLRMNAMLAKIKRDYA